MRTALYRHFDAAGDLLYVGISNHPINRTGQHIAGSEWAQLIARVEIEWHESRIAAYRAESHAIAYEAPLWNSCARAGYRRAAELEVARICRADPNDRARMKRLMAGMREIDEFVAPTARGLGAE